jgi:hypothetical protein
VIIDGKFAGFDPELLRIAAQYSEAAYHGIDGAKFFRSRMRWTQAYLVQDPYLDVLTFPGTADWFDFLIDASALPPVPYGNGWCHPGFALAHRTVRTEISKALDPNRELLICGHSLGGALCEKQCDFTRHHRAPVHMVAFGKPNLHIRGRSPGLNYLQTQLSVVHGSDIITRLPRFLYEPEPGQDQIYFDNDRHAHFNPSAEFKRKDCGRRDILKDHFMLGYVERVNQLLADMKNI